MAGKFDPVKYRQGYDREHYERVNLSLPKGSKQIIQDRAKAYGLSTSQYVMNLVQEEIGRKER
jgi:uncharacterized protein (DUF1778 family)